MEVTIGGGMIFAILVFIAIVVINRNVDKYRLDQGLKWDFLEAFFAIFVFGVLSLIYILIQYWDLVFDPQNFRNS